MAWWHTLLDELIVKADANNRALFEADGRFPGYPHLLNELAHCATVWCRRRDAAAARSVQEKTNELAAAAALLSAMDKDDLLTYEPPLRGTKKTIDFFVSSPAGPVAWIDVKTVSPEWRDTGIQWQRFQKVLESAPREVRMIRARKWAGAGIANQDLNSRLTFVRKTIELETKAGSIEKSNRAPVAMLFCTNGFAWSRSTLEDFADFYRTGSLRSDDGVVHAITDHMTREDLAFDGSLAGFHFLERKQFDVASHRFGMWLQGPQIGHLPALPGFK